MTFSKLNKLKIKYLILSYNSLKLEKKVLKDYLTIRLKHYYYIYLIPINRSDNN